MLERIKAALDARKENDKGFSLVELAVVIVIIGILVAVAIPIFLNMQTSAERAALETGAANGAAMAAAAIASDADATEIVDNVASLSDTSAGITVSVSPTTGLTIDNYCVTATNGTDTAMKGGASTCTPARSWD